MLNNKTIAVVVPAYNEENQIGLVLETMPDFVDRIIVVNDCSKDNTGQIIESYIEKLGEVEITINEEPELILEKYQQADSIIKKIEEKEYQLLPKHIINHKNNNKLVFINLERNSGVGGAIAVGYKWAKQNRIDCIASMDGDGQMDPRELISLCTPVVNGIVDWTKGNRFAHKSAPFLIPRKRFLGNAVLSILTKIASGYWKISDTQTGFTAISLDALSKIKLHKLYKRYGMPNDRIIKLNLAECSLKEVPIKPVYDIGENSTMKIRKVIRPIAWLLFKSFFKRISYRYLYKSFHPLFILYYLSFFLLIASIPFGIKILRLIIEGLQANPVTVLAFIFLFISGFQSLLFAMWMDIQDNERLYKD